MCGLTNPWQYIFDEPVFYQEGATATDVRQGGSGDCWFLSALCALGNKKNLIDSVCVHRDEQVGVYGFVFHRGKNKNVPPWYMY